MKVKYIQPILKGFETTHEDLAKYLELINNSFLFRRFKKRKVNESK